MVVQTKTDPAGPAEWLIQDPLIHLREWRTNNIHQLPAKDGEAIIGAADGCWIQVQDSITRVSRQHAKLTYDHASARWFISDLHSKNGTFLEGARRMSFPIEPGTEIGIGGVTLVAESPLLCILRELLARLIGWAEERRADVDLALRAVRKAATRRESLLICGDGDLVSVAKLLHRHSLGHQRPFIVCDPRRKRRAPKAGRSVANYDEGMAALAAATGGTLCIWRDRQPKDFPDVRAALKDPASRVQLVVCTRALPHEPDITSQIVLPPLAHRTSELNRVIDAYAVDAVVALDGAFSASDRDWVRQYASESLDKIETATRRLVAIRGADGSVSRAANQLRMAHSSLSTWLARREQLPSDKDRVGDEGHEDDEDQEDEE